MPLTQVQGGMILPSTTLTTPIVATTMGVGGATPAASGSGITFPATQSASTDANTLDDYEEGTWTPTLVSTGGSAPAYSTREGQYIKVGGVIYLTGIIGLNGTLPSGNYVRIQNLPFSQKSSTFSAVAIKYASLTGMPSGQFLSAVVSGGELGFTRNDGNGEVGVVGLNASYLTTTSSFIFTVMYQAA